MHYRYQVLDKPLDAVPPARKETSRFQREPPKQPEQHVTGVDLILAAVDEWVHAIVRVSDRKVVVLCTSPEAARHIEMMLNDKPTI